MSLKVGGSRSSGSRDKGNDVYQNLRASLLAHSFPPLTQLNIREQAERMGVSSTPVREALLRLSEEEIVLFAPGRGFFTKPLTFDGVYSDYEMEKMILLFSIAKFASAFPIFELHPPARIGAEQLSDAIFRERVEEYASFVTHLHLKIALSTGNKKIHGTMLLCCDRLLHVRTIDMADRSRLHSVANDVSSLLGSLMRRRVDEAIALVSAQFEASVAQIERVVRDGNARAMECYSLSEGSTRL